MNAPALSRTGRTPLLILAVTVVALSAPALGLGASSAVGATTYVCTGVYAVDNQGLQVAIDGGGIVNISGTCLGNWDVTSDVTLQAGSPGATLNGNATGSVLTIHHGATVW